MKGFIKLFVCMLLGLLTACGAKQETTEQLPVYRTFDALNGRKLATLTGCFQEAILEKE